MFDVTVSTDFLDAADGDIQPLASRFDFSQFDAVAPMYAQQLADIADPNNAWWSVLRSGEASITATRLMLGATDGDGLEVLGTSFTQIESFADFDGELSSLFANASFSAINLYHSGDRVASLTLTDTGYTLTSGAESIHFKGSLPTSFADMTALLEVISELLYGASSEERLAEIITLMDAYALDELAITTTQQVDGEDVQVPLLSLSQTTSLIKLEVGEAAFTVEGTFPDGAKSIVGIYDDIFAALNADGTVNMGEIADLAITAFQLTDTNGDAVFRFEGDFSGIDFDANGNAVDATLPKPKLIIEGSDSVEPDEGDTVADLVFSDQSHASVQFNLNGGHDIFEIDGRFRGLVYPDLAPTHVDGGDGFDSLLIEDKNGSTAGITVDWAAGDLKAFTGTFDNPAQSYALTFENIERVMVDLNTSGVSIQGDDENNRVQLIGINGFFNFDGGEGWDTMELHRIAFQNGVVGLTFDEALQAFDFELQADGSVNLYQDFGGGPQHVGTLNNIEQVRVLVAEDNVARADWQTTHVFARDLLDLSTVTGTEGEDELLGNNSDNLISGLGGDDIIRGFGSDSTGDTIDAGAGFDYIEVSPGDHSVDGGADFDVLNVLDDGSAFFEVDMVGGTISGFPSETGDASYVTEIDNIEGVVTNSDGDVQITGSGDWIYIGLDTIPNYLSVNNGEGRGRISLRWTETGADTPGVTLEQAQAHWRIVPTDFSGRNFDIYNLVGGEFIKTGELRGITDIQFYDPDAANGRLDMLLTEVQTTDHILEGTSGDDTLTGTDEFEVIYGYAGDDLLNGQGGDDFLSPGVGNATLSGGAGDDVFDIIGAGVDYSGDDALTVDDLTATDDVVEIFDASGRDTLRIYDHPNMTDSWTFIWDGQTVTRETTFGHKTIIDADINGPVIEQVEWVGVDENFNETYSNLLQLIVDQADFTRFDVIFAGTDLADTITAPDISAANVDARWGEIFGNGGDDTITISEQFQYFVYGGSGNDTVTVAQTASDAADRVTQIVHGQDGNDRLTLGRGNDHATGGDGNDTVSGQDGDDSLWGNAGNDLLAGDNGNDLVNGGEGNDTITLGTGEDTIDGGAGIDTLLIDTSGTPANAYVCEIDLSQTTSNVGAVGVSQGRDNVTNIENIQFIGDISLNVTGDGGSNTIDLDAGNDTVNAGDGADAVYAGAGDDDINGGAGDDFLQGGLGNNQIDGGVGTDTALYEGSFANYSITEDGTGFDVTGTGLSDDVDNVELFSFSDQILTAGMIRSNATNGNDTIAGSTGNDTVDGGAGNDSVAGGAGDDEIFDALGDDTIDGGAGSDTVISLSGNNSFVEADEPTVNTDTSLDDYYAGGYGDDDFFAGGGNDVLIGDRGSVFYFGDDTLSGGTGDDILQGSGGADVFVFRSGDGDDTIGTVDLQTVGSATNITDVTVSGADFEVGLDQVDLTDFGYGSKQTVLDQLSDVGGNAVLTTADGTITFFGVASTSLGADDFII